jgi:hypothetical protein
MKQVGGAEVNAERGELQVVATLAFGLAQITTRPGAEGARIMEKTTLVEAEVWTAREADERDSTEAVEERCSTPKAASV